MISIEVGGDGQARPGRGGTDKVEDLLITVEWLGGPVLGDLREQSMFDGIPFGSAGGVVGDGDGETEGVAELSLEFSLPGPAAAAIAAARIGQNQELASPPIANRAFAFPPAGDGMSSEGGSIVGDADKDRTAVGQ